MEIISQEQVIKEVKEQVELPTGLIEQINTRCTNNPYQPDVKEGNGTIH